MDEPSAELVARYRRGDQEAAADLFERYLSRLVVLARSRLSAKIAARVDPEDVALSACRSFFVRARDGRFTLRRSGDLWRLLAAITLRKLYRQVERHQAARRSVAREVPLATEDEVWPGDVPLAERPTPEQGLALADELEHFMSRVAPLERRVLELRLQGLPLEQIAHAAARSERSVRRILSSLETALRERLLETGGDDSDR